MGDKGGKKDKEKEQKQTTEKQNQKTKKSLISSPRKRADRKQTVRRPAQTAGFDVPMNGH